MTKRHLFLLLVIFLLVACNTPAGEPGSVPTLEQTVESAATEISATAAPVLTNVAATAAPALTEVAVNECPELPAVPIEVEGEETILPEGAVILFQKSGGFAGVMDTWTIYADGQITKDTGESWQVAPELVNGTVAAAAAASFFDLERRYVPENTCCDLFIYTVTVRDCEQVHTVTAIENAPEAPEALWQVIRLIEQFVSTPTQ
ncbi:MAG: hypothetical protein L0332_06320 [Chloroflexi bacterium]|nr:hypothetical protein [Chloroflexota bacterium]MCI0577023.1 hypothetical protein [Chloroflexota bacterium]MCI0648821.1 hypothetical protein [Chloroflexota bacterium]MCI0726323.1 hypothetical protein [Chloroflexota bacterium]